MCVFLPAGEQPVRVSRVRSHSRQMQDFLIQTEGSVIIRSIFGFSEKRLRYWAESDAVDVDRFSAGATDDAVVVVTALSRRGPKASEWEEVVNEHGVRAVVVKSGAELPARGPIQVIAHESRRLAIARLVSELIAFPRGRVS